MKPSRVNMILALLGILGLVWLAFAGFWFTRGPHPASRMGTAGIILPVLMIANALGYCVLAWRLRSGRSLLALPAAVFVLTNIVLTFTDQVGLFDLATLLLNVALCSFLIAAKRDSWDREFGGP